MPGSTRRGWRASRAKTLAASTPAGTHLTATFDPRLKWLKTSGIITQDKWSNLPGGEVLTAPARVDGVYVVDGVLGDWLAPKYGDLARTPMSVHIEDSRIARVECARRDMVEDFLAYMAGLPDLWNPTGAECARYWSASYPAATHLRLEPSIWKDYPGSLS